jgi:branched-chain amino acid transport system substrate-binding protein
MPNALPTKTAAVGGAAPARPGAGAAPASASGGGSNAPAKAVAGSPVNVGLLGLFSGILGQVLGSAKLGTQVAVAHINTTGGLNGHPINLIVADDGGDPAAGLALAKRLIDEDHVIAFLNSLNALNSSSVFPFINGRGVPVIGGIGVEPEYYTLPNAFPGAASPRIQSTVAVKYAIDQGFTKIGMLYCAEFSVLCSANAAAVKRDTPKLGGHILFTQQVSLAQPDYTSQCLTAKQAGVDGMLLAIDPNSVLRLAESCAAQNFHPRLFTLGIVFAANLTNSANTDQMFGAAADFPFSYQGPETAEFRKAYRDVTGGPPTTNLEASTWVGGLILQEAGRRLPADPKPSDVLSGLHAIKSNSFGGLVPAPLTYRAGSATPTPLCAYIVQIKDKAFVAPNGLKPTCLDRTFAD